MEYEPTLEESIRSLGCCKDAVSPLVALVQVNPAPSIIEHVVMLAMLMGAAEMKRCEEIRQAHLDEPVDGLHTVTRPMTYRDLRQIAE